jgi:hypothetical protein
MNQFERGEGLARQFNLYNKELSNTTKSNHSKERFSYINAVGIGLGIALLFFVGYAGYLLIVSQLMTKLVEVVVAIVLVAFAIGIIRRR